MAHQDAPQRGTPAARKCARRSLRFQLLFSLNAAVLAVLALFLMWEYAREQRVHLDAKHQALREEAQTLLPAVVQQRDRPQAVQEYIDQVCGRMQEGPSPGHHIAVDLDGRVLQATAHHRQSEAMLRAMHEGARSADGMGRVDGERIVVGQASDSGITLMVSEYVSNIEDLLREQVARHVLSIVVLGVVLALVLNLVVGRTVTRPIRKVVKAVRSVRSGELGVQAPAFKTQELGYLADEFNSMSRQLARVDEERRLEMEKARKIQNHLIPEDCGRLGLNVGYVYLPATEVAGDYFDVKAAGHHIFICVADVTGHGTPAALEAAMLKILFSAAIERSTDPGQILADINARFLPLSLDEDFATMVVFVLDREKKKLRYGSAGHDPAHLLRSGREVQVLSPTGPLLGIDASATWGTSEVEIGDGDRLVIVTDGFTDAVSPAEEPFGRERLVALLERNRSKPIDALRSDAIKSIEEHRAGAAQDDDVTVLAIDF